MTTLASVLQFSRRSDLSWQFLVTANSFLLTILRTPSTVVITSSCFDFSSYIRTQAPCRRAKAVEKLNRNKGKLSKCMFRKIDLKFYVKSATGNRMFQSVPIWVWVWVVFFIHVNPNFNLTTKQHAVVNTRLNIVTCPTYVSRYIYTRHVVAPYVIR